MSDIRVHVRVSGAVQGVGYRASTQREASRLGLSGWVRNLADGSVELEAEGPREAVEALVGWCRRGPWGAQVDALERRDLTVVGGGGGFQVRR